MRYKLIALFFLAVAGFASCKNGGYSTTKSGLQYIIHTQKNGKKAKEGDYLKVHYVMKTDKDSVIESSYDPKGRFQGKPIPIPFQKSKSADDMMEGFAMLGEGDSATFRINADSIFKGQRPAFIKAGEFVKFTFKVEKIESEEEFRKEMTAMREEMMKKMETMRAEQSKKDDEALQAYFKANNLNPQKTESGLYYIMDKPGSGDNVKVGEIAVTNYVGMLENGKVFDTNIESEAKKNNIANPGPYKPFEVPVGQHRVIPGWDEGLQLFRKGGKGRLFIPSVMAYGPQGAGADIPPNANLIFNVEIVDIKKGETPNPNQLK